VHGAAEPVELVRQGFVVDFVWLSWSVGGNAQSLEG
jgi:hypothetical protein